MSAAATQTIHSRPKVLFVDDHSLLLEALTFVMGSRYETTCSSSLSQLEFAFASFRPDVLVIDISMPDGDGVSVGEQLARKHPGLKVIYLTMHTEVSQVRRATNSGAQGFVSKQSSAEELALAIDTVLKGEQYHSAVVSAVLNNSNRQLPALTDRQMQVLRLVARGFSAKEIATDLNISVRTAEFHRGAIMQRLNMHSTALLTRHAVENGLV